MTYKAFISTEKSDFKIAVRTGGNNKRKFIRIIPFVIHNKMSQHMRSFRLHGASRKYSFTPLISGKSSISSSEIFTSSTVST